MLQRTQRFPWRYFQRPDATHLSVDSAATSLAGLSTEVTLTLPLRPPLALQHAGGTTTPTTRSTTSASSTGRPVDHQVAVGYLENRPGQRFRSVERERSCCARDQLRGRFGAEHVFRHSWAQFLNFWTLNVNANLGLPAWDDRITRGGPLMRRPLNASGFVGVGTDQRRSVAGFIGGNYAMNAEGGWGVFLFSEMEVKPAPAWSLSMGPNLSRSHTIAQYRTAIPDAAAQHTFGRRYVFSNLDQTVLSLDTRLNWTFAPGLTLQVFAQPFIGAFDYAPRPSWPRRAPTTSWSTGATWARCSSWKAG
jgi:hypothetical protein